MKISSKNQTSRGFTLIELLVVIAIIGILSSVVLAALNTARKKGNDAKIQSALNAIKNEAEIYRSTNGDYGNNIAIDSTSCDAGSSNKMFGSGSDSDAIIKRATDSIKDAGGTPVCGLSLAGPKYIVYTNLASDANAYLCVDAGGTIKKETSTTLASVPSTPTCP